jgi:hypothetical protein
LAVICKPNVTRTTGTVGVSICAALATDVQSCMPLLPAGDVVPTSHAAHAAEPLPALYVPAAQVAQTPPSGPVCPASQRQSSRSTPPTVELEPDGQDIQVPGPEESLNLPFSHASHGQAPIEVLNLPLSQATQVCPSISAYPTSHAQAALPNSEVKCFGQSMHSSDPSRALYLPASHAEHSVPLGPV